jgi:hypothetical protein
MMKYWIPKATETRVELKQPKVISEEASLTTMWGIILKSKVLKELPRLEPMIYLE